MAQWNQAPTRIHAPPMTDDAKVLRSYIAKLADVVAIISKDLDFIINGNLDANNIRANSIETKNLKAGSVTADKIEVNELSAISANLGHIVAGLIESVEIFGSYIATSRGSYPRAEMSNTSNLFGAYSNANRYVKMESNPGTLGAPTAKFGFDGTETQLMQIGDTFHAFGPNSNFMFGVNNLNLGGKVQVSGSSSQLGYVGVPVATDVNVVSVVNQMNAVLRLMGILA